MSILDNYRQNIKEEEESFGGNYAVEKKLKNDFPNIFRIIDPDSAVEYFEMWPVCDDDAKRPFIIENSFQGQSILSTMLGNRSEFFRGGILDSRLDEYKQKYFVYESQDPELILQIAYNNDKSGDNGSWRPSRRYCFNIIDREVETEGNLVGKNWCIENKQTKLFKMGSQGFISLLDVRDNNGPLENYDINYKKAGKGKKGTIHNAMKAGDQLSNVIIGAITKEEKAYEKYLLKTECALSLARYILKYLAITIEKIDNILGTNCIQQLQSQAELEVDDSEETDTTKQAPSKAKGKKESSVTSSISAPQVKTRGSSAKKVSVSQIQCPFCKKMVDDNVEICPSCSKKLLEPCDNVDCKMLFSVTANTCPHCGKVYTMG